MAYYCKACRKRITLNALDERCQPCRYAKSHLLSLQRSDVTREQLLTEGVAQLQNAGPANDDEPWLIVIRSFQRPQAPTIELLSKMKVQAFLLLAAEDECVPDYLLASDMC